MTKFTTRSLAMTAGLAMTAFAVAAPFQQTDNIVVHQVGDGSATLTNAASATFLREIKLSDGSTIQTINLPTAAASTGNRALNQSGTATSEGFLTRSADNRFLIMVGYNADLGTASVVGTSSATVNRVVGVVDSQGVIDSTTAISDGFNANNIRSATSTNGTDIWAGGTGPTTSAAVLGAVRYVQRGGSSSVALGWNSVTNAANLPTNIRVVNIFNGQLYASSSSGSTFGVLTVGTGLPTTDSQTSTLLNGFPTASGPSSYDFFLADANTLYVADDRSIANGGGIQKWTNSGGTWSLAYTLNSGITVGTRSITGVVNAGVATLYATTAVANGNAGNALVQIIDTGSASAFTTIATSGANAWWRGVELAPIDQTVQPCYANCDGSTTAPVLGPADFSCFLGKFRAGDSYANCDGSTIAPVLGPADFSCFLGKFRAGC